MSGASGVPGLAVALALVLVLGAAAPCGAMAATAAPVDLAKGQQIASTVCAACHNADGNSTITANPRLAGQSAEYLVKQLGDMTKPAGDKTGRDSAVMGAMAMTVSDADRPSVAAWFASQAPKFDVASNKEGADIGQRIYRTGIPDKAVPACAGCHGPTGSGLPAIYPRIGGQHAEYVTAQLKGFRDGTRRNNVAMGTITFRMSDPEITAVSDYIAGLRAR